MKFLVDAQLPARLARLLSSAGHDSTHTSDLDRGNRASDEEIAGLADRESRVVVTKDRDFRDSHLLRQSPRSLIIVTTGNISNDELLHIFERHLRAIIALFDESDMVEIARDRLVAHADRPDRGRPDDA